MVTWRPTSSYAALLILLCMLHLHTDASRSQQHGKAGKLMQRASASAVDMSRCLLSLRGGAAKRRQPRHRPDNAEDSSSSEVFFLRRNENAQTQTPNRIMAVNTTCTAMKNRKEAMGVGR